MKHSILFSLRSAVCMSVVMANIVHHDHPVKMAVLAIDAAATLYLWVTIIWVRRQARYRQMGFY
eukprot:scaffold648886_cov47-Prasinocladus_malaysianus.AAC.1